MARKSKSKSKRRHYSRKLKKSRNLRKLRTLGKMRKMRKMKSKKNNHYNKYHKCNHQHCCCKNKCHVGSGPIGGLEIKGGSCDPLVGSQYSIDKGGNYYGLPDSKAYSVDRNMMIRGGSILPDNLVNVGRQISYGAESLYNGLGGYEPPVNPAPYVQPKI